MYEFLTGPMLWVSFAVCFIGLAAKVVWYIRGLDWRLDRVTYTKNVKYGVRGALRSIGFWLLPFGTRNWRVKPLYTILFFGFHAGLVFVPLFLIGHAVILKERFGIDWMTMPQGAADFLTVFTLITGLGIIIRRIALPEVRIVTTAYDYLLLAISMAPFVTGFMAVQHIGDYQFWLTAHILTGEILLLAIPFTKLSHIVMFFLSRAQIGMDFGIKRGGMKSKGLAW